MEGRGGEWRVEEGRERKGREGKGEGIDGGECLTIHCFQQYTPCLRLSTLKAYDRPLQSAVVADTAYTQNITTECTSFCFLMMVENWV